MPLFGYFCGSLSKERRAYPTAKTENKIKILTRNSLCEYILIIILLSTVVLNVSLSVTNVKLRLPVDRICIENLLKKTEIYAELKMEGNMTETKGRKEGRDQGNEDEWGIPTISYRKINNKQ
jgi:predicted transposase YdaD